MKSCGFMEENKQIRVDLSKILHHTGAVRFGTFKLTSGRISPYYIDLRIIPSFPDVFRQVGKLYINFIRSTVGVDEFERIAGIPTAGIPFASLSAFHLRKPFLYIRQSKRLHGRERRIEGVLFPGDRVLLMDDLITTGLSLIRAASAIRTEGGIVNDVVVMLDREEGGRRKLEKEGIKLHALCKISEVAEELCAIDAITEDQLNLIKKQIKE